MGFYTLYVSLSCFWIRFDDEQSEFSIYLLGMAEFTRLTEEKTRETTCSEYRQKVKNYKENLITQKTCFKRLIKMFIEEIGKKYGEKRISRKTSNKKQQQNMKQ